MRFSARSLIEALRPLLGRRGFFEKVFAVGCALGFYVFSTGPMVKLADLGLLPRNLLVIYYPLGALVNETPMEAPLRWYLISVWKVQDD